MLSVPLTLATEIPLPVGLVMVIGVSLIVTVPLTPLRESPSVAELTLVKLLLVISTVLTFVPIRLAPPLAVMLLFVRIIVPVVFSSKTAASVELVTVLSRISALVILLASMPDPVALVIANPDRTVSLPIVTVPVTVGNMPVPDNGNCTMPNSVVLRSCTGPVDNTWTLSGIVKGGMPGFV